MWRQALAAQVDGVPTGFAFTTGSEWPLALRRWCTIMLRGQLPPPVLLVHKSMGTADLFQRSKLICGGAIAQLKPTTLLVMCARITQRIFIRVGRFTFHSEGIKKPKTVFIDANDWKWWHSFYKRNNISLLSCFYSFWVLIISGRPLFTPQNWPH